jgi:hypothetical protein
MKSRMIALAGLVALIGSGAAFGVMAQPPGGTPTSPPAGKHGQRGGKEKHPEMRRALRALQNAKSALQAGAHDLAGHRDKALDLTNQAIKEVQAAIASDKK